MKKTKIIITAAAVVSAVAISAVAVSAADLNVGSLLDANTNEAEALNEAIIDGDDLAAYEETDLFAYAEEVMAEEGKAYDAEDHYGVNEYGMTYGSSAWAKGISDQPDLILVEATNGKVGYVYGDELDGGVPETVNDVEEYERTHNHYFLNVYESDGKTVIGEFEVAGLE